MALDFTTDPGGLFVRLGRVGKLAHLLDTYQDGLPAVFDDLVAQYQSTLQAVGGFVAQQQLGLLRSTSSVMGFAQSVSQQTVLQMVEADEPAVARSLHLALREVIRQMVIQAKTVQSSNVTFTKTALPTNDGTGQLVTSAKRGDGLVQENAFTEQTRIVCTADAYSGGATEGREVFTLTGETPSAGVWDFDYPQGSGASVTVRAVTADDDATAGANLLTNGDAEEWTDSPPELDNWTLETGVWGTDAQQDAAGYRGSFALEIVAGTTNTTLYQEFDSDTGTSATLSPLTSYAVHFWAKEVAATAATGVLTVELVNDSGTVINDEQGVANSFTVDLTSLGTTYVPQSGVFRLPANPPDVVRLRFRISTDLTGDNVLIDDICMAPLTAMYTGGPGFVIFSGATQFTRDDGWELDVDNDRPEFLASWQGLFDRLFGMRQFGLLLPSSGSPNIDDALITG